jgi:hypothetical protein
MNHEQISISVGDEGFSLLFSPGCVLLEENDQRTKVYVQGFEVVVRRLPEPTSMNDALMMLAPNPRLYDN